MYKMTQEKLGKQLTKFYEDQIKISLPEYFKNGDIKMTDNVEIANYLFFVTNIGKDLIKKITNHCYYITGNFEIHFHFQDINEESIFKIIDNFPTKASSGGDGITLKQWKYLKYIFIKPITLLNNQILNTGYFQVRWKLRE